MRPGDKQLTLAMHRLIMAPPAGLCVDHINHDGLDNRRCNLRICTQRENSSNMRAHRDSNSPFKGVCYEKAFSRWRASIGFKGVTIYLGIFPSEIDAALAYNEAALKYHGEFACLNDVDGNGHPAPATCDAPAQ
jgi:hypothetical protein